MGRPILGHEPSWSSWRQIMQNQLFFFRELYRRRLQNIKQALERLETVFTPINYNMTANKAKANLYDEATFFVPSIF